MRENNRLDIFLANVTFEYTIKFKQQNEVIRKIFE